MNLAFLDLEFHQRENRRNDFQIIRISIVKTDMLFNIKGECDKLVKADITEKNIDYRIQELTQINLKKLNKNGVSFENVTKHLEVFLADVNYVICWGDADERVLKSNYKYNKLSTKNIAEMTFIDAQKCYGELNGIKDSVSLVNASKDINYYIKHNSVHDVYRLMAICKKVGIHNIILSHYRVIKNINDKIFKKTLNSAKCPNCGGKLQKTITELEFINKDGIHIRRSLLRCIDCNDKILLRADMEKHKIFKFNNQSIRNEKYFSIFNELLLDGKYRL